MTKEEIKQICQIYDNLRAERDAATIAYNSEDTFWGHVLATYELSQPSLPSNLDEAAVLSANGAVISRQSSINGRVVYNLNEKCFNHEDLVRQFKAGAKWMAEQGETLGSLIWKDEDDKLFIEAFVDENKFKMAENVTIQIRKKQQP